MVFLGIFLAAPYELGYIITATKTMSESNDTASTVVNKKKLIVISEKVEEEVMKKHDSKILAELLPDLPAELRIENIQDLTRSKHFEHLASVHLSDTPTNTAGRWVKSPLSWLKETLQSCSGALPRRDRATVTAMTTGINRKTKHHGSNWLREVSSTTVLES
jgi:hypothetical protein